MKPKASVKHNSVNKFLSDMDRAIELYERFTIHAVLDNRDETTSPLMYADRRDVAAFIFLEAAANFETFSYTCFEFAVRRHFKVNSTRAEYIMGSSDRGTLNFYGWVIPELLEKRGKNLFGRKGFFGRLSHYLSSTHREQLRQAHIVRNRIAHSGSSAPKNYHDLLNTLSVPKGERSGLSAGRLLMEYPGTSRPKNRLFYVYIRAYKQFADSFRQYG